MIANRKIQGASLIGCALIGGALTLNHLRPQPAPASLDTTAALTVAVAAHEYIPESDHDNNGIEDWREQFITGTPLVSDTSAASSTYVKPTTITDQVGIQLLESAIRNKSLGKSGQTKDVLAADVAARVQALAQDELYGRNDLTVVETNDTTIRTYGNTLGQSIIIHNVTGSESELDILNRVIQTKSEADLAKLAPLADMYKKLRDDALTTPVPDKFVTNHINLVNAYNSMYKNLDSMRFIFTDPMVALLRTKRYQTDTVNLAVSLNTMDAQFVANAEAFRTGDDAEVFKAFSH